VEKLARASGRTRVSAGQKSISPNFAPISLADPAANAARLASLLAQPPPIAAQAAYELGTSGADEAAELIERNLPTDAADEVVAAAAAGLVACKSDATERVLVALALRPSHPAEALNSLFVYYRSRGAGRPAPVTLPDRRLLEYASAAAASQRAAFGELARAVKDPAIIPTLVQLAATDSDFEVRRAATQALGEGPSARKRQAEARAACLDAIAARFADQAAPVVIAACRAAASYDDARAWELLGSALGSRNFNVRVAAIEGLGQRKAAEAAPELSRMARTDPSVSVRYAAATQLAALDPGAALPLERALLGDPSAYLRTAGIAVLAKSAGGDTETRLANFAKHDAHVRVRIAAVEALEGRNDAISRAAVQTALNDQDPVVVSTACSVAAKNQRTDLVPAISTVPRRFGDGQGADAREGALTALAQLDAAGSRELFASGLRDPNPQVRGVAEKNLATLDHRAAAEPSRGADLTGALLPGGAPLFGPAVFLIVETDRGTMRIRLFPEQAPIHCAHVAALARQGFYDGLNWHRVVPDFVIQGGCPRGTARAARASRCRWSRRGSRFNGARWACHGRRIRIPGDASFSSATPARPTSMRPTPHSARSSKAWK
jgi:HEAT repeat protein